MHGCTHSLLTRLCTRIESRHSTYCHTSMRRNVFCQATHPSHQPIRCAYSLAHKIRIRSSLQTAKTCYGGLEFQAMPVCVSKCTGSRTPSYIHTYIPVLSRAQTITSFVSSSRRCSSDSSHETDYRNHAKPRTQHGLILLVPFVPSLPVFLTSNVRLYV